MGAAVFYCRETRKLPGKCFLIYEVQTSDNEDLQRIFCPDSVRVNESRRCVPKYTTDKRVNNKPNMNKKDKRASTKGGFIIWLE